MVVPKVVGEWERFGIYLEVEHVAVKIIKKNHPFDCKAACEDMLMRWLTHDDGTGDSPREWSTAIDTLDKTELKEEARELKQRVL